jgi:hypothetical protein
MPQWHHPVHAFRFPGHRDQLYCPEIDPFLIIVDGGLNAMSFRPALIPFLAICMTDPGHAQEKGKAPPPKSHQQLLELAKPGPEHKELQKYAGEWAATIRMGAGESAKVYSGKSINRMVADGRFLLCEFDTKLQNEAATGILTLGFDRRHGEYTIQSMDSWGTYFVTARGKRKADSDQIKLYGTDDDPHMTSLGLTKEFAFEFDFAASEGFSINVYMIDTRSEERREMLMMEYQFTKTG